MHQLFNMGEDFKPNVIMYTLKARLSAKFNGNGCRWIIYLWLSGKPNQQRDGINI